MTRIFISYRRADSAAESGRIYDRLATAFGGDNVFKDVDDIPPGADFRTVLEQEVSRCDVLLAVIGPRWATITDEDGRRRLHDPDDYVNIEVEAGLSRGDVLVIPLLVGNAAMPAPEELPENLRALCYRNGMPVRYDPDFHRDMQRLIERIQAYDQKRQPVPTADNRRLVYAGAFAAAVVLLIAGALLARQSGNGIQIAPFDTPTLPPTSVPIPTTIAAPTLTLTVTPSVTPAPASVLVAQAVASARENARVWSAPDVSAGEFITDLAPGTRLVVVDGPERGSIRLDSNLQSDWYQVRNLEESAPLGWLWIERLSLSEEVQLTERRSGQMLYTRDLYETSPRLFGGDVLLAQGRLRALGYALGVIDGYYGPLTAGAVRAFQQRNDLTADSVINPVTWNRLFSPEAVPAG